MAVRFDASTENLVVVVSLGAQAQRSLCCWGKIDVDRNAASTFISIGSTAGDTSVIQTNVDGTTLMYWDGTSGNTPTTLNMTVGKWYFIAAAINGANGNLYAKAIDGTTWTTVSWSDSDASITATNFRIGESQAGGGEWLNGSIANAKLWVGATLTQNEFEQEMWQYMPTRTANLTGWWPLLDKELTDYTGNGRTLTGGAAAAGTDGPGIPWRTQQYAQTVETAPGIVSFPPVPLSRRSQHLIVR